MLDSTTVVYKILIIKSNFRLNFTENILTFYRWANALDD